MPAATNRQSRMSSRLPAHSDIIACSWPQVHALRRIRRFRPAQATRLTERGQASGAVAAADRAAWLSHQHASNAFLQMEQSASMFHFHTPTACQRTYFSFMRTKKEEEERQTEGHGGGGGGGWKDAR